jgi:hypothetical protein
VLQWECGSYGACLTSEIEQFVSEMIACQSYLPFVKVRLRKCCREPRKTYARKRWKPAAVCSHCMYQEYSESTAAHEKGSSGWPVQLALSAQEAILELCWRNILGS